MLMAETHDVGRRHYWTLLRYPDMQPWEMPMRMPRFTETATTDEIEPPYRSGQGRLFRFWPSRSALVIGRWTGTSPVEDEVVSRAVGRREMEARAEEIRAW